MKNFAKFTGKNLRQSLFFNKVAGLRHIFIEHLWTTAFINSRFSEVQCIEYIDKGEIKSLNCQANSFNLLDQYFKISQLNISINIKKDAKYNGSIQVELTGVFRDIPLSVTNFLCFFSSCWSYLLLLKKKTFERFQ